MIDIQNLTKQFGKYTVLDGISVKINKGDRIALIGQNGAGKTTLIRIILGQYLSEGSLTVFGKNPRHHRVEVLDRIGFVPQLPPPIQMSVGELVNFSASISQKSSLDGIYAKASDLGLDIEHHVKKPFQKLSGGMKQKLLIALALARQPDILIMDEPAANLDPSGRQAFFLQLIRSMEDTTMLLSSHRVDEVINLINRIIEIDYGKITQDELIDQAELADKVLACQITFTAPNDAATRMLKDWNFTAVNGDLEYQGNFIGAERLRFLTTISHFANHIQKLSIN
ncbi:MAG: ABC transporter ATP-binding protein [Deltaproteobacteria bacterium]|jgi:ABC-2 type transport system ATP-binding protein|nr:ABC transporter ATP-binding protein [Deltaproteobacteria bacterium]MBT4090835.1 ABC transporter ATP-binding protein [Deltaproteobacteria bacterium]MBT4263309.1 ABC transporter ATP-binding protein [Deltaproteobacteria bacterium]MBT4641542.1 ABC transporter ATP-binding protein [Deltaproteobacteria bacterium]MBT6503386.1 ABC transporter ATP-binding protein [Deltaproteobacteria bacterium]